MKPDEGYICCIVNPKAGAISGKKTGRRFGGYLAERGFDVRVSLTASLDDACCIATAAASDRDCAMVVGVGGDGTIREIAHGLEGSDKPLMIVPCGTENLLANELGFDGTLRTAVRTFEAGRVRRLDLGIANGRCFTSIAGFGFDGRVVGRVHRRRAGHIDYFDYFQPIWRTFWEYGFDPMRVEADGEEVFNDRGLVFVGNISRYALGLQILPKADFGDGLLDVCVYRCCSHLALLKHSAWTVLKRHVGGGGVIYRQAKKVTVSAEADIDTQIDGDPGPSLPVRLEILPGAVKCLVPAGARPAGMRCRILRVLE
jgi:YegS/Rv2252/BmrU family lipid kinase